ncbi:hypothetical protein AVEN_183140-1 [Araneus ventricosus]|uniref:Uncharacterized protein n=1 Tax=Araneus ventricosus TaxID=182803 RepID=A0A4Y2IMZ2_ARAVE|nr:hypothetical protein AVEN_183140-1 [Araneus ventricosus]
MPYLPLRSYSTDGTCFKKNTFELKRLHSMPSGLCKVTFNREERVSRKHLSAGNDLNPCYLPCCTNRGNVFKKNSSLVETTQIHANCLYNKHSTDGIVFQEKYLSVETTQIHAICL